jgi:hypothetical protein
MSVRSHERRLTSAAWEVRRSHAHQNSWYRSAITLRLSWLRSSAIALHIRHRLNLIMLDPEPLETLHVLRLYIFYGDV